MSAISTNNSFTFSAVLAEVSRKIKFSSSAYFRAASVLSGVCVCVCVCVKASVRADENESENENENEETA